MNAEPLPLWQQISLGAQDEGLSQCLTLARGQPEVVAFLTGSAAPSDTNTGGDCQCSTLTDLHMLTSAKHEAEDLRDLLDAHDGLKRRAAFLSKLRQAWRLADKTLNKPETGKEGSLCARPGRTSPTKPRRSTFERARKATLGQLERATRLWIPPRTGPGHAYHQ